MKLSDLKEHDAQLDEILPALGAVGSAIGGVASRAAGAIGGAVKGAAGKVGQAMSGAMSGLAGGGMDPAQAAQASKDQQEQKKQIQDAIKQKQAELADLQKQLAQIG
jgi:hypothetical protein